MTENPKTQQQKAHAAAGATPWHSKQLVKRLVAIVNRSERTAAGSIPWVKIQRHHFPQMSRHAVRNLYLRTIRHSKQQPPAVQEQEAHSASRGALCASQSDNAQVPGEVLAVTSYGRQEGNQVETVDEDVQVSGQIQTLEKGVQVDKPVQVDKEVQVDKPVDSEDRKLKEQLVSLKAQIASMQRTWDTDREALVSRQVKAEKEAAEYKRMYGVSTKKYVQMESTFKLKTQELQNTIQVQATRFQELESSSVARNQQHQKTINDMQARLQAMQSELAHVQLYRIAFQTISGIDTALDAIARYRHCSSEGKVAKNRIAHWVARSHTKYFGFDRDFSSYYSVRNRLVHDDQAWQQIDMENFCQHALRILRQSEEVRQTLVAQTQPQ